MYTLGKGGLWLLRIRTENIRLTLPVPLYVITDLLVSLGDLCELILPRFGQPNYVAGLQTVVNSLLEMPPDTPLLQVETGGVRVECKRISLLGGR